MDHQQCLPIIPTIYRSSIPFPDHLQDLQIILIIYTSYIPLYRPSIVLTGHSYYLQVTRIDHPCLYRLFLLFMCHSYHFMDHPQLLQIITIVYRSSVPFYRPSIAFTDHSYSLQVTRIVLYTINIFCRSFLLFADHPHHCMDHLQFLQILTFVYRSSVPYYRPSIAFTDHSYRLQVNHIVLYAIYIFADHSYHLRTFHSFYRSFLPFTGLLYCFADHLYLLQIIPIVNLSSIPFYGPPIAFTDIIPIDHLQVIHTVLQTIHSVYRSFLPFTGQLSLYRLYPQCLLIIPTIYRSPVMLYGPSILFAANSYYLQIIRTFLQTIYSVF